MPPDPPLARKVRVLMVVVTVHFLGSKELGTKEGHHTKIEVDACSRSHPWHRDFEGCSMNLHDWYLS